ncbi:MAG: hypothetical protein IKK29_02970, partial [Christensenellaceae bacterium]|nr:hypothetical protein [Christensenellaceae bacterium]
GEAELVGGRMDKVYRPRISVKLLAVFVAILTLGFVLRTISGVTDMKSILCFGFGAVMFFVILRFWNIGWMFEKAWWFIGIYTAAMAAIPFVYTIDIGVTILPVVNGVIGQLLYLQILQPLIFAMFVWKMKGKGIIGAGAMLPFVIISLFTSIAEPQLFVAGAMGLIDLAILLYAIAKGWLTENRRMMALIVAAIAVVMIALVVFVLHDGYYFGRMAGMFSDEGWHGMVTKEILANCRFFGEADFSAMRPGAAEYLSYRIYLLALAAEFGLWVLPASALLMGGLIFGLVKLCLREKAMLCRIMSLSIVGAFFMQSVGCFAENLGMSVAALPMPFISYGNTSLIFNMVLMGMLFCILGKGWMYSDESTVSKEKGRLKIS